MNVEIYSIVKPRVVLIKYRITFFIFCLLKLIEFQFKSFYRFESYVRGPSEIILHFHIKGFREYQQMQNSEGCEARGFLYTLI